MYDLKIQFECAKCGDGAGPVGALMEAVGEMLGNGSEYPPERNTVVQCLGALLVLLLDRYITFPVDGTSAVVRREVEALIAAMKHPDDETMKELGLLNRTLLMTAVRTLEKTKHE